MCKCLEFSAILTQLSHKKWLSDWVDGPLLLPVLFHEIVSWYEPWPKQTLQGIFHVRLYFEKHELNDSDLALCPSPCSSTHFKGKELLFFSLFFFFFFEDVVAGVIQCWNFILLLYFCRGGLCAETLSRVNWRQEKKLLWGNLKWRFVINEFSLFILSLKVECNHCLIKYCHILVHNLFAVFSSLSFVTSVFICYQQN